MNLKETIAEFIQISSHESPRTKVKLSCNFMKFYMKNIIKSPLGGNYIFLNLSNIKCRENVRFRKRRILMCRNHYIGYLVTSEMTTETFIKVRSTRSTTNKHYHESYVSGKWWLKCQYQLNLKKYSIYFIELTFVSNNIIST